MFDAICSRRGRYVFAEFDALRAKSLILLPGTRFEALGGGRKARRPRKRLTVARLSLLFNPFGLLGLFNQLRSSHLLTASVHPP